MNRCATILSDCKTAERYPLYTEKRGNEETLQIMNVLKLSGIMSLLMGGWGWWVGGTLSFVVSRGPQIQELFTDIIISFNLSIHIQKTQEAKKEQGTRV